MSINGTLKQISPALLQELQENPALIQALLYLELVESYKKLGLGMPPDMQNVLQNLNQSSKAYSDQDNFPALDLAKNFNAIHFILDGSAYEITSIAGQAIFGGQEIGENLGYGPARFLTSEEVKVVATELAQISEADFRAKFDPVALKEEAIYPYSMGEITKDEGDILAYYYNDLVNYYQDAAQRGNAMLLYLI
jgi:hypothetical protein